MTKIVRKRRPKVWINDYDRKCDDWYFQVVLRKERKHELVWTTSKSGKRMIEPSQWRRNRGFYCPKNYIEDRWGNEFGCIKDAWQTFSDAYFEFVRRVPRDKIQRLQLLGIPKEHLPTEAIINARLILWPKAKNALENIFDADQSGDIDDEEYEQLNAAISSILQALDPTSIQRQVPSPTT